MIGRVLVQGEEEVIVRHRNSMSNTKGMRDSRVLLARLKFLQNLEEPFGTPRATCLEVKVVEDPVRGELLVLPRYSACVQFLELGLTLVIFVQIPLEKNEGNAGLRQVLGIPPITQIISK